MVEKSYSLHKILIGTVNNDGTMPDISTMTELTNVKPESLEFVKEDDTEEKIMNLETDIVENILISEIGALTFAFQTWKDDIANKQLAMGGELNADGEWGMDVGYKGVERSLILIGKSLNGLHSMMKFPRVNVKGSFIDPYTNSEPASIKMIFTVMQPTEAVISYNKTLLRKIYKGAAPINGIVDDVANTFGFAPLEHYSITDYEYSKDNGVSFVDVVVNPITGLTGAISIGYVKVRLKAITSGSYPREAGYELENSEAYTA